MFEPSLMQLAAMGALMSGSVIQEVPVDTPELRIARDGQDHRVEIVAGGRALLTSPVEGLWSIACDWGDRWPAEWRHAKPSSVSHVGEWTILEGTLELPDGSWRLRDAYRPACGVIQCTRRFEWTGKSTAQRCTLSVRYQAPGAKAQALLPGILYYGNPSGARSGKVPVYGGKAGEEAIFEEHRYPMPFACIEWRGEKGLSGAALHSIPSPAPYGHVQDQWWSLGVRASEACSELVLLSGPCASNGKRSVIKAVQPGFVDYGEAYLDVPPGAVIEKTFYLDAFGVAREGGAFQRPIRTSLRLFQPFSLHALPRFDEIVRAKARFARTRWYERGEVAGFKKFPDRDFLVLGWCGQAASAGYAFGVLAKGLGEEDLAEMARKSLDFLSGAAFYDGGFHTWYDIDKKTWNRKEIVSQGQAMLNFALAIGAGRARGVDTGRWEAFLRKACDVHADRILAGGWRPVSTNEAFFIAPLCRAFELFGEGKYKEAAVKAGRTYAERHVSMREPYWGGTLDASCEDKEGAYAALQGFLALYELTKGQEYLRWAEHACDVVLTYVVAWDIDLPPGRLRDHGFRATGWTVVSPQNQHIDVFGVLIAPEVYRLGRILGEEDLQRLAIVMYRTCGQLIDPYGSQGEQPQHTNYAQRGKVEDVYALRGGYQEHWTVFWITAHFLNAAAQFEELGVPIWR
ncbi:MAG: hypothetical protein JXQ73_22010 [Phycisphaerae bacterium]|nr:hypothetical protein [Phycisphaerae bacterium]